MPFPALFGITVVLGLAAWGAVAWHYIWPALRERSTPENLKPILLLHGFRFLGFHPGRLRATSAHNPRPRYSITVA
jgi:hypothetical protein